MPRRAEQSGTRTKRAIKGLYIAAGPSPKEGHVPTKRRFISHYLKFSSSQENNLKDAIRKREQEANQLIERLTGLYRETFSDKKKLDLLLHSNDEQKAKAEKEYALLCEHKGIRSFELENGKGEPAGAHGDYLKVVTNPMFMQWEEKDLLFPLPSYTVKINIQSGDPQFYLDPEDEETKRYFWREDNLDRIITIHPHIFGDRRPCLGNYSTIFPKIVASGDYSKIIDLLLEFLRNYNDDSPATSWGGFTNYITNGRSPQEISPIVEDEIDWED